MNRVEYLDLVADAIYKNLGLKTEHMGAELVREEFEGEVVWVGQVELFICPGLTKVVFAWGVNEGEEIEIVTVAKTAGIFTPRDAVRAWIASSHKRE